MTLFLLGGGITTAIVMTTWASLHRVGRRPLTHQEQWDYHAAWRRR
jgi:hypothetical protein